MKLSIITPFYKTLNETQNLAKHLEPQLTDEIEWIIVDDGCNEYELDKLKAKVVHCSFNSGNASTPRNIGLFYAKGDYITFIDSDDDVTGNYIKLILEKIEEGFDCCYLSWSYKDSQDVIITDKPPEWNHSVWNRVYKKSIIDGIKFDKDINYAEDKAFIDEITKKHEGKDIKFAVIEEPIYIYTYGRKDSLSHKYINKKMTYKKSDVSTHKINKRPGK